ncbi:MAG: LysR family transcriptional regulator [Streptosporangiales bacterium]|nr:LysR family transcriptional regulator [Streptosporangiales bacterium]
MELRHVRYFVAVAEERSFTRAAERLRVAQSPLSQQIRKLERELGVELFVRTTRSVQLTHAGSVFYGRARRLLAGSDEAVTAAQKAARGELGRLSLGFTGSATYELLPALVRAYHERNPDVTLDLHSEMLTPAQVDALLEGRIAVGVLRPPVNAKGLVVEVLREEPIVVLLPVQHPAAASRVLDLKSLRDETFVGYPSKPPSTLHSVMVSACRQAGFVPAIRQEVAETATLVTLVAAGLGLALVPASVQHLRIEGATYRPISSPRVTVQLALAYREDAVNPLVRRYLEIARSVVRSRQRTPGPATAPSPVDEDDSFSLSL